MTLSRQRSIALFSVAVGVVAFAAAACSGGGGGGGGGGPSGSRTLTLDGTNFTGDSGDLAFFRLFNGGNIAYCSSASIGGGSPTFEFTTPATLGDPFGTISATTSSSRGSQLRLNVSSPAKK